MEQKQLEDMIAGCHPNSVIAREDIREWVIHEQQRLRRRARQVVAVGCIVFVVALVGIWGTMNRQLTEIQQLVGNRPSRVLSNLEEVTWEVCQEPPAEYFVQQLAIGRRTSAIQ